jgi:hypothetical protein
LLIGEGNVEANEIIAPQQHGSMTRRQLQTVLKMDSSEASASELRGTFDVMFRFYPPPATPLLECADDSASLCGHHAHADASTHRFLLSHFDRLNGRFCVVTP